jgi:hypothetical protein
MKNMKKQLMIAGIILILLTVGLSGCNEKTKKDSELIVGNWKDSEFQNRSFTFLSNRTGSWAGTSMIWKIEDGKLLITLQISGSEPEYIYEYSFSDNNKSLTLNSVSTIPVKLTLVKQ